MDRLLLPLLLLLSLSTSLSHSNPIVRPNIVWFLTDDQDQLLGGSFPEHHGVGPMPKTKRALADQGTTAERFYAHTPICNPSRAEILSGRYFHNIKRPGGKLWSMHVNESKVEKENFVRDLHDAGYTTALIGKYLNTMPNEVPPGFDVWLANDGGTYIAPWFQMYNTSFLEMEGLTMAHRDHHECWNDKFSDDNATTTRRLHENNEYMLAIEQIACH